MSVPRMSKIIAQAQVWNCAQFLTASILPIHKYVDEIWLFDGAYKHMKKFTKVPWSTDGTKEIAEALNLDCKLVWVSCTKFFETQIAKLTFMINHLDDGDWLYLLSDDEIATMNVESAFQRVRNEKKADIGFVPMLEFPRAQELHNGIPEDVPEGPITGMQVYEYSLERQHRALKQQDGWQNRHPRFWRNKGMHFRNEGRFYNPYNSEGTRYTEWPRINLDEMCLWHFKWLREKNRHKMQLDYEGIPTSFA